jgi:deoxyadenosine/deoxycytidine kinase
MADLVVLVSGNIGAGKSELLKQNGEEVTTNLEFNDPVALQIFYDNRKAHSGIFENSNVIGRVARHLKAKYETGTQVFDRGMLEGAETFCFNSWQGGYMKNNEFDTYHRILREGLDTLDRTEQDRWLEKLIVYLRVEDPRVLSMRQKERDGMEIPLNYISAINDLYEQFFTDIPATYAKYGLRAPGIMTIDASVNMHDDPKYHSRVWQQIMNKITEIKNE